MMINEVFSYLIYFFHVETIIGFKVIGNSENPVPFQGSHITYSVYIAVTVFILMFKFTTVKHYNPFIRLIMLFFICTMTINLFISIGRTGQVLFTFTGLFFIMIYFSNHLKWLIYSSFFLLFTMILAYNLSNNFQARVLVGIQDLKKVVDAKNFNSSLGVRLGSYLVVPSIIMADNNLWIGTGFGDMHAIVHAKTTSYFGQETHFAEVKGQLHNTFLEVLVATGVIGLLILFLVIYSISRIIIQDEAIRFIKYLLVSTIIFSSISVSIFSFRELMMLISFMLVSLLITKREEAICTTHKVVIE